MKIKDSSMNIYLEMMDIHQEIGHLNYMEHFGNNAKKIRKKEM